MGINLSRNLNNKSRKKDILKLRSKGKSYRQIQEALGCSKSTIAYHCDGGKEKARVKRNNKKRKPICRKVSSFRSRCSRKNYVSFRGKVKTFKRRSPNPSYTLVNSISINYSCQDVIDKLGENPTCYLTGKKINLNNPETYNLDHVIPTSKGGTNDLKNLNICTQEANQAKGNLSLDELFKLCEDILSFRDEKLS